jgi:hypothetical protein
MEMHTKGNGTFQMGNGLTRQQRLLRVDGVDVCVFRVREDDAREWEPRWCADAFPLGFADDSISCCVSRTTLRLAICHAVVGAKKPLPTIVVG